MVYSLWFMEDSDEISLLFIVYSLWFMENSGETTGTAITKQITTLLLYYSTILLKIKTDY